MSATKREMTKLEKFVWNNPHADFAQLATQLNRTVSSIENAYDRASKKNKDNQIIEFIRCNMKMPIVDIAIAQGCSVSHVQLLVDTYVNI